MSVSDWNRRTKAMFPLPITVEDRDGHDEFGDEDTFLAIMIGDTTIWQERADDRLYWDPYGDGGPGLDDAVIDKVGEILGRTIAAVHQATEAPGLCAACDQPMLGAVIRTAEAGRNEYHPACTPTGRTR